MTIATDSPDWAKTRLRYQAQLNPGVRSEIRSARDIEITFLAMDSIGEDGTIQLDKARPVSELLTGYSYFENNDVLLAKVTPCFENGKGALITGLPYNAGFGTTEVTVLRPGATLDPRFLFYMTSEDRFKQGGVASMTGAGGLKRVPDSYVRDYELALPNVQLQGQIADYLDVQTAKIDALIGKQEQLIETLAERRQAVISHAVTKGLDPNAPMKETGSIWFPSIPASWGLVPTGSASILIQTGPFGSQLHADEYVSGGIPVINPSHIIDGQITPSESVTVDEERARELERHRLRAGDIVVARRGEIGRCAVVGRASAGFLCGTGSLIVRLRSKAYVAAYFQLIFSSEANRAALTERSIGATMDNLNGDIVARLRLPHPSLHEQEEIIEYLNQVTAQIDALSAKAREMIGMLKERRQALISAAVTGKIDVRGLT